MVYHPLVGDNTLKFSRYPSHSVTLCVTSKHNQIRVMQHLHATMYRNVQLSSCTSPLRCSTALTYSILRVMRWPNSNAACQYFPIR